MDTSPEARQQRQDASAEDETHPIQDKPCISLNARTIQRVVAHYGKVAGIKGLTPHVLRHTCAKSLIDQGVSIDRVADILGHKSLETTRRYTQASQADLQAEVEKIATG